MPTAKNVVLTPAELERLLTEIDRLTEHKTALLAACEKILSYLNEEGEADEDTFCKIAQHARQAVAKATGET